MKKIIEKKYFDSLDELNDFVDNEIEAVIHVINIQDYYNNQNHRYCLFYWKTINQEEK